MESFSDHGIDVNITGGEQRTTCPQCSPNRSKSTEKCLAVDTGKGTWFCHHCAWTGGLKNSIDKPAIQYEPKPKVYCRPKYKASDLPAKVIEYFQNRGIGEEVLVRNQIGYNPASFGKKGGILFPYLKGGAVVNIKHRSHDKDFRQEKNAEKCLYRFDEIEKATGPLVITEGEVDALSIQEAGHLNVSSIPDGAPTANSNNFTSKFDFLISAEGILNKSKKIILAMDNDPNGRKAEEELTRRIGVERCWRVEYPEGCKDANDVLVKHGAQALAKIIRAAKPMPVKGLFQPVDIKTEMTTLYEQGEQRGALTGWPGVDELYSVRPGEMTILTGIPGSGKSNIVDAMMVNLVGMKGWRFAIFSPENWPIKRHIKTLLEKVELKPFAKRGFKTERMSFDEMQDSLDMINDYFYFIVPDDDEMLTVDTILAKAKIAIYRHGIKGLVLDPWNEFDHDFDRLSETQYISRELSKIRRFARRNQIHIWVVAHPTKLHKNADGIYDPPTMYDINGGANWRNKADCGICIHRPDYKSRETLFIVQKIRFREIGAMGSAKLLFNGDSGTYSDGGLVDKV